MQIQIFKTFDEAYDSMTPLLADYSTIIDQIDDIIKKKLREDQRLDDIMTDAGKGFTFNVPVELSAFRRYFRRTYSGTSYGNFPGVEDARSISDLVKKLSTQKEWIKNQYLGADVNYTFFTVENHEDTEGMGEFLTKASFLMLLFRMNEDFDEEKYFEDRDGKVEINLPWYLNCASQVWQLPQRLGLVDMRVLSPREIAKFEELGQDL